jgi:hypothetical protein
MTPGHVSPAEVNHCVVGVANSGWGLEQFAVHEPSVSVAVRTALFGPCGHGPAPRTARAG